jgi:hypothetical protein
MDLYMASESDRINISVFYNRPLFIILKFIYTGNTGSSAKVGARQKFG